MIFIAAILYFFIFFLGATVGSFICAVDYSKEDLYKRRSKCNKCQNKLRRRDLIPLLSYLILRGKCYFCKTPISKKNLMYELIFGILSIIIFLKSSSITNYFLSYFVFSNLLYLSKEDLKNLSIPTAPLLYIFVFTLIFKVNYFFGDFHSFSKLIVFLLVIFGGFKLLNRVKLTFGDGDMYLFMSLLPYFNNKIFDLFFYSICFATFFVIILLLLKKVKPKTTIPFIPFIFTGAIFVELL